MTETLPRVGDDHRPRRVVMLVYPGCNALDAIGPLEVFATADQVARATGAAPNGLYRVEMIAPEAGLVRCHSGLQLHAERSYRSVRGPVDTLFVAGGVVDAALGDDRLVTWIARMSQRVRRTCSVCTGAALLAEAGLLDGHRATTHWAYAEQIAERYPQVEIDPEPIFLERDGVWTSAGVTSGIDLALELLRADHGHELAMEVARDLVVFLKRPGGQSQFSAQLQLQRGASDDSELEPLLRWIDEHLDDELTAGCLAERAHTSRRNLFRQFDRVTGTTPAVYVERRRVEAARRLLEEGSSSLEGVARRCGFRRADRMRQAFHRQLGVTPAEYRRRFPGN